MATAQLRPAAGVPKVAMNPSPRKATSTPPFAPMARRTIPSWSCSISSATRSPCRALSWVDPCTSVNRIVTGWPPSGLAITAGGAAGLDPMWFAHGPPMVDA